MSKLIIPILVIVIFLGVIAAAERAFKGPKQAEAVPTDSSIPAAVVADSAPDTAVDPVVSGSVSAKIEDNAIDGTLAAPESDINAPAAVNIEGNISAVKVVPAEVTSAPETKHIPNAEFMQRSNDPLLKKLAEYENCCGSVFGQMMVFTSFPANESEAREMAGEMAVRLKEFAAAGVAPLVAVEPLNRQEQLFNFARIIAGDLDRVLRVYFAELVARGVTESQIGTWNPIPEPNLNEWGQANHNPADFAAAYNHYARIFREYYPKVKLTVLLDNETYDAAADDTKLVSLLPWTAGIDKGLVDSFGLQGYPWRVPANAGDEKDFAASSFLSGARAIEAAKSLGVAAVWFSTGTFSEMFSGDPDEAVYATADERGRMLTGILDQAKIARAAGFDVMVCIFAEDKSDTDEATDFSYWNDIAGFTGEHAQVLKKFTAAAASAGISLAVYDSD